MKGNRWLLLEAAVVFALVGLAFGQMLFQAAAAFFG
jgi:hypothetical protein